MSNTRRFSVSRLISSSSSFSRKAAVYKNRKRGGTHVRIKKSDKESEGQHIEINQPTLAVLFFSESVRAANLCFSDATASRTCRFVVEIAENWVFNTEIFLRYSERFASSVLLLLSRTSSLRCRAVENDALSFRLLYTYCYFEL